MAPQAHSPGNKIIISPSKTRAVFLLVSIDDVQGVETNSHLRLTRRSTRSANEPRRSFLDRSRKVTDVDGVRMLIPDKALLLRSTRLSLAIRA